jgi:hypothetical protein
VTNLMTNTLSPDEALAALADVRASMTAHFGAHHEARLGQLGAALDTAVMADRAPRRRGAREVDLANRIIARDTVHGQHEVVSPVSRAHARHAAHRRDGADMGRFKAAVESQAAQPAGTPSGTTFNGYFAAVVAGSRRRTSSCAAR